jgi:hypothetical protein
VNIVRVRGEQVSTPPVGAQVLIGPNSVSFAAGGGDQGTSIIRESLSGMLRRLISFFILSLAGYLAYKSWTTYPDLIPDRRGLRRISKIADRDGISQEAAYIRWANQRLRWTRHRHLARNV